MLLSGEGEQLLSQLRAALGGADRRAQHLLRPLVVMHHADEFEIAEHGGQQVIEVMRDAAGELADRLHLLGMAQSGLDGLALLGLGEEPRMGFGERMCALLDALLQSLVEALQRRSRELALLQVIADLVLAATRAQGGSDRRGQRRRAKRPVEQDAIAETRADREFLRRSGRAAAGSGGDQDRQIGPRRLPVQPFEEGPALAERLLVRQHRAGAAVELGAEIAKIAAPYGREPDPFEDVRHGKRVLARRGEDQNALLHRISGRTVHGLA